MTLAASVRQLLNDPTRAQDLLAALRTRSQAPIEAAPHDVEVLSHDVVFGGPAGRELDYFYYELVEFEGTQPHHYHKAVGLVALDYLPREFRETVTMLDRMIAALAGLHNQRADFVSLVAGMFEPVYRGVYQCYGVQGYGPTKEEAVATMRRNLGALRAVLVNFQQSRFVPLRNDEVEWLRRSFADMDYALVGIGQPEPRRAARGMSASTRDSPVLDEQVMQGSEYLYRALQALAEEFIHLTLAVRLEPRQVNRLVEKYGRWLSDWASRQEGTRGVNVGISMPVFLSGMVAAGAGTSYGASATYADSVGAAQAQSVGHTAGVADGVTVGQAESVGRTQAVAQTRGTFASTSRGEAQSEGYAHGASESRGQAQTVGQSDAVGQSHVEGQAHTVGSADARGSSRTVATVTGTSLAQGSSQAVTDGKSINSSVSANAGGSVGLTPSGSLGIPGVAGVGLSSPMSLNTGIGGSLGVGLNHSETAGQSVTSGIQASEAVAHGTFKSHTDSVADTTSVADGTSQTHADSLANTRSQGQATNEQWSQGLMRSQGWAQGSSRATTVAQAVSQTQTRSQSQSHVVSQADSVAESASLSRGR
ncbi:MAG: hypothetical protein KKB13_21400, partial [Chloroflexi bacterium]|nr:hypothetical protein [Chloroflexota bacterium]